MNVELMSNVYGVTKIYSSLQFSGEKPNQIYFYHYERDYRLRIIMIHVAISRAIT